MCFINIRNYERQDFSELLKELSGGVSVGTPFVERDDDEKNACQNNGRHKVSEARRRRASLMDNFAMLYAYSERKQILHDRDCIHVKEIPDKEFCMTENFIKNMALCADCQRRIYIRHGIGDDRRRIADYERFFNRLGLTEQDLYLLLIVHKAKIKWINNHTMQIRVREDTWRVIFSAYRVELWHNNYSCLEDYSRSLERDFHLQTTCGFDRAPTLFQLLATYSYEKHIEMRTGGSRKQDDFDAKLENPKFQRKEAFGVKSEFVNGILFEENPFENEAPDGVVVYDLDGNELSEAELR